MRRYSGLIGFGTALGIVLALVPVVRGNIDVNEPLRKLRPAAAPPPTPPSLVLRADHSSEHAAASAAKTPRKATVRAATRRGGDME